MAIESSVESRAKKKQWPFLLLAIIGIAVTVVLARSASDSQAWIGFAVLMAGLFGMVLRYRQNHPELADSTDRPDAARPIAYTPEGQPIYPIVGYTADGVPITADRAVGFAPQMSHRTNSDAIAAFVVAFILPPLAIPLGHYALSRINKSGEKGATLATIALALGYLSLVSIAVLLIAMT